MAKPSRKKAATKKPAAKRKPAAAPKPVDVVTAAPEPTTPEQEIAKFDHDGDGHVGGSLPHDAEAVEPTPEANDEATEEAPTPAATEEAEPPAQEPEAPETVAPFQTCQLGPVECRVGQVPLGAVLGLLDPDGLRRIEAEKSTASFEPTRQRLLATDGRATPVVFAQGFGPEAAPSILHGYAELAAADDAGVKHVTVILVPPGGASEAQSHIVEMVRQQRTKDQPSEDDELFYRVHAEG